MSNVLLRVATLEDAKAIQAIYAPYVETTAITFEEVVPSVEEFEGRIQKTLENFPYLVLEEDGEVVGYAYAGRFSARAAFDWSTEVSIYISLNHQRKGYGKLLYAALEKKLLELGYQNIYACVAVPEVEDEYLTMNSVNYHKYLGFEECGHFKNVAANSTVGTILYGFKNTELQRFQQKRPNQFTAL